MTQRPKSEGDIVGAFVQAMVGVGLRTTDRIIGDGELHRFHVEGDPPRTQNGWYVLFLDTDASFKFPAGEFGCWKRGLQINWCARSEAELTPAEQHEIRKRIEAARAERAERERQRHEATAAEARRIWDDAAEHERSDHPYLVRKGVKSHGLRVGVWPTGAAALLVPVNDAAGNLVSLQAIFQNVNPAIGRDKDFLPGGKKRGCWFSIGSPPPSGVGTIILCEGYATGATLHEATGLHTAVAFDVGNLKAVAYELRRRWPGCTILVAADNDRWTVPAPGNPHVTENPGVTSARAVAEAIPARVLVAVPEFPSLEGRPTDFNDLAAMAGLAAVRAQIEAVLPPPAPPASNDNAPAHLPLDAVLGSFGFPHVSEKGQLLNTVENLAYLLEQYGITVRYNQMSKEVEICIPDRSFSQDNERAASLSTISSLCARNRLPRSDVDEYITVLADANPYNPAADWIDSKPWDGVDRIGALAETLDPSDPELARALLRRWMIGAAGCLYEPNGMAMQGILVLQGAQNAGKTTWFKSLAGHNKRLAKEGASLNPSDRDSVKICVSYWLTELGELDATFRRADLAALKSFVTRDVDELFKRYSRASSKFPRRTAFVGTVNPKHYLHDETGNRRYWTIRHGASLRGLHDVDMQQAWAQAKALWASGEQHRLTPDELARLNALNEEHAEPNTIEELIAARFYWGQPGSERLSATEVLIAIGYDRPANKQAKDAGGVLRKLTGKDPVKSNGRWLFELPPRVHIPNTAPRPPTNDDDWPL